ncbi:hypothetical protein LCGC14_2631770, partial [marine sediment metagenome]
MADQTKSSKAYVIGIDSGTSSTRAILFDEKGQALAEGRRAYDVLRPQPGWVEQKAVWWWEALAGSIRDLLSKSPVKSEQIQGLAITHQRITAVPVDRSIEPLRNAILWNDIRCSEQNEKALETVGREKIYQRTGYNPGIWTVYKAMWLQDNEPDIYHRMHKFLLVQDYLMYRLIGKLVTTSSAAVMTGCLDVGHRHRWAEDILEGFEISPSIWVENILSGGQIAGRIHREASLETGLPEGLPVVTAAGDQPPAFPDGRRALGDHVAPAGKLGMIDRVVHDLAKTVLDQRLHEAGQAHVPHPQFTAIGLRDGLGNVLDHGVKSRTSCCLGNVCVLCHLLNQFSFSHVYPPVIYVFGIIAPGQVLKGHEA